MFTVTIFSDVRIFGRVDEGKRVFSPASHLFPQTKSYLKETNFYSLKEKKLERKKNEQTFLKSFFFLKKKKNRISISMNYEGKSSNAAAY